MTSSADSGLRRPGFPMLATLLFFALVGGFLLSAEHRAHAIGVLPFLLILALCPLMHLFMHGGHGGHGSSSNGDSSGVDGEDETSRTHRH